jgi:transcription elongation factor
MNMKMKEYKKLKKEVEDEKKRTVGLNPVSRPFVPVKAKVDLYSPMTIMEFKNKHRDFLRGKKIKIMDGIHYGHIAIFRRYNGTQANIIFQNESQEFSLSIKRLIQVIESDGDVVKLIFFS